MRSELAIKRELAKVERMMSEMRDRLYGGAPTPLEYRDLCGTQQALAWALEGHAIAPAKAVAASVTRPPAEARTR